MIYIAPISKIESEALLFTTVFRLPDGVVYGFVIADGINTTTLVVCCNSAESWRV